MEKRKHTRFAVRLPVACSGQGVVGEGVVTSISESGCALEMDTRLEIGTHLTLQILVPDHYSPTTVDRAAVRWVGDHRVGLEFVSIRPKARVRLGRIVKTFPSNASRHV